MDTIQARNLEDARRANGQFGHQQRHEATTGLGTLEPLPDLTQVRDDYEAAQAEYKAIADAAAFWSRATGVSREIAEDMVQEGALAVAAARANGKTVEHVRTYSQQAARRELGRALDSESLTPTGRRAASKWKQKKHAMEQELGRELTSAEGDELARKIRETWHDPRHRPEVGFHTAAAPISTDFSGIGSASNSPWQKQIAVEDKSPEEEFEVDPHSDYNRALDAATGTTGTASLTRAKMLIWNALCDTTGGPKVTPGTLSQNKITAHRKVMEEVGFDQALSDAMDGVNNPATQALLAAFPDPSDHERAIEMFDRLGHNGHGEALWVSTLQIANTRNRQHFV